MAAQEATVMGYQVDGEPMVRAMALAIDIAEDTPSEALTPWSVIDAHWEEVRALHGR